MTGLQFSFFFFDNRALKWVRKHLTTVKKIKNLQGLVWKPLNRDSAARVVSPKQILVIFGGRYNRYFWGLGLKTYALPNCNMLLQVLSTTFSKSEVFSSLWKVDHVPSYIAKGLLRTIQSSYFSTQAMSWCLFYSITMVFLTNRQQFFMVLKLLSICFL